MEAPCSSMAGTKNKNKGMTDNILLSISISAKKSQDTT